MTKHRQNEITFTANGKTYSLRPYDSSLDQVDWMYKLYDDRGLNLSHPALFETREEAEQWLEGIYSVDTSD